MLLENQTKFAKWSHVTGKRHAHHHKFAIRGGLTRL